MKNIKLYIVIIFLVIMPMMVLAYPKGDVNGDDKVTSTDYIAVRKHILKQTMLTGDKFTRADLTGDNKITSLDYIAIRKLILNINTTNVEVTDIKLDETSLILEIGKSETLTATISPNNATNKTLSWSSSNTAVATVDANGKVTAKKAGSATIIVKSNNNKSAQLIVNVENKQSEVTTKTFTATFVVQDSNGIKVSKTKESCTTNNSSTCEIVVPTITANSGYEAIGWNGNKNSTSSEVKGGDKIKISKDVTYYSISRKSNALKATFSIQNGMATASGGVTKCYLYNGKTSCEITAPNLTANKPETTIIGWNTDKSAKTSSLNVGTKISISQNIKYYSITKTLVNVTFNVGENITNVNLKAAYLSLNNKKYYTNYSSDHTKCVSYNGNGCNIKWIPTIVNPGQIIHGYAKTPDGEVINVAKTKYKENTTLYARIYDTKNYFHFACSRYEIIGMIVVQVEDGVRNDYATTFINYMRRLYNDMPQFLLWNGTVSLLTQATYKRMSNNTLGITSHGSGFGKDFSMVLVWDAVNSKQNFYQTTIHEIAHAYNYGLYWNGALDSAISKTSDIVNMYNKYGAFTAPYYQYIISNSSEFHSELMTAYYHLYRKTQYNDPPYPANYNSIPVELVQVVEKYNQISLNYYRSIGLI